jgi:predicted outer membrane repeat protein
MAKRQRQRRRERRREHAQQTGWRTQHSVITGAGIAATATLGIAGSAMGAVPHYYFVGSTADTTGASDCTSSTNTDCTLRDAINDANANSGQYDYVIFQPSLTGNVALTGGQIPITDSVYIYGNGPGVNTITAAASSRIFDVDPVTSGDVVEIAGFKLTGGNVAGDGGAVRNNDARLRLFDAIVSGNTAGGAGGGVYEAANDPDSGYYNSFAGVTFSNNHADTGGAIASDDYWGFVRSATFSDNHADAGFGGAVDGFGGYLYDSTVSGNSATASGGGVSAYKVNLFGTILANNTAGAEPDLDASNGNAGFDLVKDPGTTGIGAVSSVITGQDPQLGGLQNNGGDTPTLKPAASSPVVDQSYSFSYYDQRGLARIVDNPNKANATTGPYAAADIGSVELTLAEGPQAPAPPPPAPVHKKKCKKKKKKNHSASSAKKSCKKKKKKRSVDSHRGFRFEYPSQAPGWASAEHNAFRLNR